jgi:hypothetical protein
MNENDELTGEAPEGVEDLLYSQNLPPEFHRRCAQAGEAAYAINLMRQKVPETRTRRFGDLVDRLAEKAGVSLHTVLSSLGLSEIGAVEGKTAQPLARLARLLGLPLDRAEAGILMTYQALKDPEAAEAQEIVFRNGQSASAENMFRDWVEHPPEEFRGEVEWIRRAIESEYDELG